MNSIDEQIRKALTEEDQRLIDEMDDQAGLFDMIGMSFKGKQAWLTYYMYFLGFATFVVGLYCLNQFFATDDLKSSLSWLLAMVACLSIFIVIKVIGWQQLNKLEIMREIKRLEMRIMLADQRREN